VQDLASVSDSVVVKRYDKKIVVVDSTTSNEIVFIKQHVLLIKAPTGGLAINPFDPATAGSSHNSMRRPYDGESINYIRQPLSGASINTLGSVTNGKTTNVLHKPYNGGSTS
jgi:hypothetical protein